MASPVEAQLLLCDAAVADPSGKVHMLGAGWSITTSPTAPHAVVVLARIPWDRANQRLPIKLQLRDGDGQPVTVNAPDGTKQEIGTDAELEVGRPPGVAHGSMLDASFAINLPALPLQLGRYEWHLEFAQQHFNAFFQVAAKR